MKKIFRLSLALLLTFSLIFSSLIFANAAGTDVNTGAAFTTAVAAGGVVNLTGDITLDSNLTLSTSVTINGNGHTITGKQTYFTGDCTYIFNNVNYVGSGKSTDLYRVQGAAKVILSGGSLKGYETSSDNELIYVESNTTEASSVELKNGFVLDATGGTNMAVNITTSAKGTFILNGATIKSATRAIRLQSSVNVKLLNGIVESTGAYSAVDATSASSGLLLVDGATIKSAGTAMNLVGSHTAKIISGKIITTGNARAINLDSSSSKTNLIIGVAGGEGPVIENTASAEYPLIRLHGASGLNHTIYGGTFTANGKSYVIDSDNSFNLSIIGGTFTANGHHTMYVNTGSVVNILGGEFSAGSASDKNIIISGSGSSAIVNIRGGNFKKGGGDAFAKATYKVTGGTFDFNPTNLLDGYKATENNGSWTVAADASAAATVTEVGSDTAFNNAITAKASYIKITAGFTLKSSKTIDFDTVIDGNGYTVSGNGYVVTAGGTNTNITFKNFKFETAEDALPVEGTANVVISGGEIYCTKTSSAWGSVFVKNFNGTLLVTDGANLRSACWNIYTSDNGSSQWGVVVLRNCNLVKGSTVGKGYIYSRSNINFVLEDMTINATLANLDIIYAKRGNFNIANSTITNTGAGSIYTPESNDSYEKYVLIANSTISSSGGRILKIDNGSKMIYVSIQSGTFTTGGSDAFKLGCSGMHVVVNGGTFTTTGNSAMFQAVTGRLDINGGTFSVANTNPSNDGAVIDTDSGTTCVVNVNNTVDDDENSINHTGGVFLKHSTASQVTLSGLNIEQDGTIITIESGGGDITLDNCKLTAKSSAIVSESSAKITLKNDTHIYSKDTVAVSGGTWEKLDTSDVHDETSLHEFAKLVKETLAADRTELTITKDYTDVPAITIDKNLKITSNGKHSITFVKGGFKVASGATLTIEGADLTINGGSEGNVFEAEGTLIINSGTFNSTKSSMIYFDNAAAKVILSGGTFTQAGSQYLVSMGKAAEFTVGNADGTGPSMTHTGSTNLINTISSITAGTYTINGGTFTKSGSSYIMQVGNAITPAFTINGGEFTINHNAAMFALRQNNTFVVNGGTFTSKATSEELIFKVKGNVKIYGGAFTANSNSLALIGTSTTSSDAGSIVINDAFDGDSDLSFTQNGTAPIIGYNDAGTVEISNTNIARTGVDKVIVKIDSKAAENGVTITNSNLSADYAVISMPDTNAPVRLVLNDGAVLTSKFDKAIYQGVLNTNYTMNGTAKIEESDTPMDGSDRILIFAGKANTNDYPGVEQFLKLDSNTEYTYTFNYRTTFGGVPYVTMQLLSSSGWGYRYYWGEPGDTHNVTVTDTGTSIEVKFNTGELDTTKSNFHIRLGNKAPAAASTGTVYYGNVSLTKSGSSTNLIENGNFGWGLKKGWNLLRSEAVRFYGFILPVEGFFDDAALENKVINTPYVLEGGNSYHSFDFKALLEAGTSYKYSYISRSVGDVPEFAWDNASVITVTEGESNGYLKTYTVTNTSDSAVRVRFRFIYEYAAKDARTYLTNLKLYKLNGDETVGTNMIADLNPIFGTSDAIALNGDDDDAMERLVGHGWFGTFKEDADQDGSSDKYSKIVAVSNDFFNMISTTSNVRNTLLTKGAITYNLNDITAADDVLIDGKINVVDLFIGKMESKGLYGADVQADALKNAILNAKDTPETGNVVKVPVNGDFTTAFKNASSGTTILLERGGQWYMPNNTDDNAWEFTKNNITIGAYTGTHGTAKPVLIGSAKNYADATWSNQGNNIWKMKMDNNGGANIPGAVYFFDSKTATQPTLVGTIINSNDDGDSSNGGVAFTNTSQLTKEGDVYREYNASSGWFGSVVSGTRNNVYIYCEGNPNTKYDRIYITESSDLFYGKSRSNITIDNLCIKYVGAHGINFKGCENITVTNCEIGYIGGAPSNTTLGNGIQFGMKGNNLIADHNYIYQCYDAGITPQSWTNDGDFKTNLNFTKVKLTNNLLTNNFDNIEVWNHNDGTIEIEISGNILKDAAYCWSYDQRPKGGNIPMHGCHIYGGRDAYNPNLKIQINDNIFDTTQVNIFCWFWGGRDNAAELPAKYGEGSTTGYMTFSGNSYYQKAGAYDGGQVNYYGKVTKATKANTQSALEAAVAEFDTSNSKYVRWVATNK